MGPLQPDGLGLRDLLRDGRSVPDAPAPVPSLPADDFDLRDADAAAVGEGRRRGGWMTGPDPLPPSSAPRGQSGDVAGSLPIHGLMAEFENPNALVAAAYRAHAEGYRRMDAYSPFPIEELHEALGSHHTRLPLIVLVGGILGCIGGYLMPYWTNGVDYPVNVAGKPLNAWPMFIPVTFECTILGAALAAVFGMLALNGLPMPYHPVFNVPRFALASRNRFFLCIEARDPKFEPADT